MKEEKVSTQRKICIANEVLEAVETYCIAQRKTLQYVIEEVLHYNYGYASQCFKKVTQITLSKYVNRRILTEVYRKHMQEYEGYTREESVDGIKNFKRRMKAEFGDPVENLQDRIKIDDDNIDDLVFDGEMRRYCKKEVNKLEEGYIAILAKENRFVLIENGEVCVKHWENKMIKYNEGCYTLHGTLLGNSNIKDPIFSGLIQKNVYVSQSMECPVEKILEFLVAYHDGNRNEIPGPFSFSICNLESDGRWEKRNLISSFEVSLENKVLEIKLSPQWLKWEDNNLYLYLE